MRQIIGKFFLGLFTLFLVRLAWELMHLLGYAPELWAADLMVTSPGIVIWGSAAVAALSVSLGLFVPLSFGVEPEPEPYQGFGSDFENSPSVRLLRRKVADPQPNAGIKEAAEYIELVTGYDLDFALSMLRDEAHMGRITVWGRAMSSFLDVDPPAAPIGPIPKQHWANYQLDASRCITGDHPRHCCSTPEFRADEAKYPKSKGFADLRVDMDQIKLLWPE